MNDQPRTGNGSNPLRTLRSVETIFDNPKTVGEYLVNVRERTANLDRIARGPWKITETKPLILETIARLEGDLQGLRSAIKLEYTVEQERATAEILSHLERGPGEG